MLDSLLNINHHRYTTFATKFKTTAATITNIKNSSTLRLITVSSPPSPVNLFRPRHSYHLPANGPSNTPEDNNTTFCSVEQQQQEDQRPKNRLKLLKFGRKLKSTMSSSVRATTQAPHVTAVKKSLSFKHRNGDYDCNGGVNQQGTQPDYYRTRYVVEEEDDQPPSSSDLYYEDTDDVDDNNHEQLDHDKMAVLPSNNKITGSATHNNHDVVDLNYPNELNSILINDDNIQLSDEICNTNNVSSGNGNNKIEYHNKSVLITSGDFSKTKFSPTKKINTTADYNGHNKVLRVKKVAQISPQNRVPCQIGGKSGPKNDIEHRKRTTITNGQEIRDKRSLWNDSKSKSIESDPDDHHTYSVAAARKYYNNSPIINLPTTQSLPFDNNNNNINNRDTYETIGCFSEELKSLSGDTGDKPVNNSSSNNSKMETPSTKGNKKVKEVEGGNGNLNRASAVYNEAAFQTGIQFEARFIGSLEVSKPTNRTDIVIAMRRIRFEFKANSIKKRPIKINVSIKGITVTYKMPKKKFAKIKFTPGLIDEQTLFNHPIYRVFYVSHDSQDLKIFSYIARDCGTDHFKCNVFKADKKGLNAAKIRPVSRLDQPETGSASKMDDAMLIVRTIGQAFEVCHKYVSSTTTSTTPNTSNNISISGLVPLPSHHNHSNSSNSNYYAKTTTDLNNNSLNKKKKNSTDSIKDNGNAVRHNGGDITRRENSNSYEKRSYHTNQRGDDEIDGEEDFNRKRDNYSDVVTYARVKKMKDKVNYEDSAVRSLTSLKALKQQPHSVPKHDGYHRLGKNIEPFLPQASSTTTTISQHHLLKTSFAEFIDFFDDDETIGDSERIEKSVSGLFDAAATTNNNTISDVLLTTSSNKQNVADKEGEGNYHINHLTSLQTSPPHCDSAKNLYNAKIPCENKFKTILSGKENDRDKVLPLTPNDLNDFSPTSLNTDCEKFNMRDSGLSGYSIVSDSFLDLTQDEKLECDKKIGEYKNDSDGSFRRLTAATTLSSPDDIILGLNWLNLKLGQDEKMLFQKTGLFDLLNATGTTMKNESPVAYESYHVTLINQQLLLKRYKQKLALACAQVGTLQGMLLAENSARKDAEGKMNQLFRQNKELVRQIQELIKIIIDKKSSSKTEHGSASLPKAGSTATVGGNLEAKNICHCQSLTSLNGRQQITSPQKNVERSYCCCPSHGINITCNCKIPSTNAAEVSLMSLDSPRRDYLGGQHCVSPTLFYNHLNIGNCSCAGLQGGANQIYTIFNHLPTLNNTEGNKTSLSPDSPITERELKEANKLYTSPLVNIEVNNSPKHNNKNPYLRTSIEFSNPSSPLSHDPRYFQTKLTSTALNYKFPSSLKTVNYKSLKNSSRVPCRTEVTSEVGEPIFFFGQKGNKTARNEDTSTKPFNYTEEFRRASIKLFQRNNSTNKTKNINLSPKCQVNSSTITETQNPPYSCTYEIAKNIKSGGDSTLNYLLGNFAKISPSNVSSSFAKLESTVEIATKH